MRETAMRGAVASVGLRHRDHHRRADQTVLKKKITKYCAM